MGNAIFQGLPVPEPPNRFPQNFAQLITLVTHITCKNLDQSAKRGRVCTCVNLSSSGVYFLGFKGFFSFMLIATGPPVGPIITVNGLNDAFWWLSHSLYGLVNKNWNLPPLAPKSWKFALQPIAASKSHNSGIVKDTCKMFAPNWEFSGSGNQTVLFKFLLDPLLLPWQQADVIWTQNRQ